MWRLSGRRAALFGVDILMIVVVVAVLTELIDVAVQAVLGIIDLTREAVHCHALLRCPLVCSHLQGDGLGVALVIAKLLVEDLTLGAWGRHASLKRNSLVILASQTFSFFYSQQPFWWSETIIVLPKNWTSLGFQVRSYQRLDRLYFND